MLKYIYIYQQIVREKNRIKSAIRRERMKVIYLLHKIKYRNKDIYYNFIRFKYKKIILIKYYFLKKYL